MTSSSRASKPSRRAIRPSGTVGTDDSLLVSSHPAAAAPAAAAPGQAGSQARPNEQGQPGQQGQPGTAPVREPALPVRALDDSDVGWGEASDANDDRLRRDKPPHW